MQRISTSSRAVNLFGAGKDGFKDGDLSTGVAPTDFNAAWCNNVQEELLSVIEAAGVAPSGAALNQLLLALRAAFGGVVGTVRNAKMQVTAVSATATFTADEIILETALGGMPFRLVNFNKVINLATVGAGGMDTGAAPASGFVAVYAIYNPVTAVSALLAVNATAGVVPEVYGGANMPVGYTASALVSVWPTSAAGQFGLGTQFDRSINVAAATPLLSNTQQPSFVTFSIASSVPANAKSFSGALTLSTTASASMELTIYPSTTLINVGTVTQVASLIANAAQTVPFTGARIGGAQSIAYKAVTNAGTPTFRMDISGYVF